MGKKLDLTHPVSFSEKIQWLKLYDRNPLYTSLVDKYKVKAYITEAIGSSHVIPTFGVWDSPDDIDWDDLPNQFVLKTSHGGGKSGVVICNDKRTINKSEISESLRKAVKQNIYSTFREWPYKNVPKRIIAEKYMCEQGKSSLVDYKFFCFNGNPKFLYVRDADKISYISLDWKKLPFGRADAICADCLPQKPACYEEMVQTAKILSKDFIFVRVDLYEIDNTVYFSELTFYPSSGLLPFKPQEWDKQIGDMLTLPTQTI